MDHDVYNDIYDMSMFVCICISRLYFCLTLGFVHFSLESCDEVINVMDLLKQRGFSSH